MKFHNQLRTRLRISFLFWILFVTIGLGVFATTGWLSAVDQAGQQSESDVATTSLILRQSFLDGSKLLDILKKDVQPVLFSPARTQKEFEKSLTQSLDHFSINFSISNYGIVYLIDANGNLIARSDQKPLANINLSDRYFFSALKKNPEKRFIVASLIKSRTTNKPIVSLVSPFKDAKGNFIGVLGLQIDPIALEALLRERLRQPEETISVISENNEIVLTIPLSLNKLSNMGGTPYSDIALLSHPKNNQWFKENGEIIAKTSIPELGISIISQISTAKIWNKFVSSNIRFFIFLVAMASIFSLLFLGLNRKILEADDARIHSLIDGLTQIPNRRAFDENYEKFLKDARRNKHPVSILFIDIDHFKRCNDDYGHENGDIVLKKVAELVQGCMRRPLDFCCRWGGEEIVCLLPDSDSEGAAKLAEIILKTIAQESIAIKNYPPIHVTVSIGIASASHNHALIENNLVDKADQAMYRAKQGGRNRYST